MFKNYKHTLFSLPALKCAVVQLCLAPKERTIAPRAKCGYRVFNINCQSAPAQTLAGDFYKYLFIAKCYTHNPPKSNKCPNLLLAQQHKTNPSTNKINKTINQYHIKTQRKTNIAHNLYKRAL
jgi:hypothetical protein